MTQSPTASDAPRPQRTLVGPLALAAVVVLACELIVMLILSRLPLPQDKPWVEAVCDVSLLTLLSVPSLGWILARPLRRLRTELDIIRHALNNVAIVAVTDGRGRITYANDMFCRISKYSRGELLGQDHRILNSGYHPKSYFREMYATIGRGRIWRGEFCNRAKDGTIYWVDTVITPSVDRRGRVQSYTAIRLDITARKQAEFELERQMQMQTALTRLLRVANEASSIEDLLERSLDILLFSGSVLKIAPAGAIHVAGAGATRPLYTARHGLSDEEVRRYIACCVPGASPADAEPGQPSWSARDAIAVPIRIGTDVRGHLLVFACPCTEDQLQQRTRFLHTVAGVLGIALWRLEMMADLRRARDLADAGSRAKSLFLAKMSHEIRTPMTAILGYADVLAESLAGLPCPSVVHEAVETIRTNGRHLLGLLNDVLDLSRIEAGQLMIEPARVSPVQVVEEVVSLLRVTAREKGLALDVRYETPLPETIRTDPLRLRQILVNLVGNAVKFTETGRVTVGVALERDKPGRRLRFAVEDTGIGMSPDQLERIFEAFVQGDDTMTRRFGGSGLGLCVSRHLARMLGGDIEPSSEPGRGSRFVLTIDPGPLEGVTIVQPRAWISAPPSTGSAPASPPASTLRGLRILLAEDGVDNQRLIRFILRRAGAIVDVAEDGLEAVAKCVSASRQARPYDVILMDMQMPRLDGYGATRRLRALGVHTPIIALTAHAMSGDREKCLRAGCDAYATKPIDRDALLRLIQQTVQGRAHAAGQAEPTA